MGAYSEQYGNSVTGATYSSTRDQLVAFGGPIHSRHALPVLRKTKVKKVSKCSVAKQVAKITFINTIHPIVPV